MNTAFDTGWTARLRGTAWLGVLSFGRLLKARQAFVSLLLVALSAIAVVAWALRREASPARFVDEIILPIYVSFLLPVLCLCNAAPSVAGERNDGTLVYLLAAPLPRPLLHAAKFVAAGAAALLWTLGSLALLCWLGGPSGREALPLLAAPIFWSTWAYVGLFHLFSVVFRRATVVALGYALLVEAFLGNVPGIVKRVAVSFYTHSAIFAAAEPLGMESAGSRDFELYQPISGPAAMTALMVATAVLFLAGTWQFTRREYQ